MVIKGEMSRFKTCYQREYAKNPNLAGKVTLRFMINKEGKVEGAEVKDSTLKNVLVERCMLKQIYGISFPKPGDEPAHSEDYLEIGDEERQKLNQQFGQKSWMPVTLKSISPK